MFTSENVEVPVFSWSEKILPWIMAHGIKIVFIIVVTLILNRFVNRFITRIVRIAVVADKYSSKEAEEKRENTLIHIFTFALRILLWSLAILTILQEFGVKVGALLGAAGIVGVALGFGAQSLVRDVISGLFIIIENQYRIGDVIDVGTVNGTVEDITLRKTTLRDIDGTTHHIPHGEIKIVSNKSKDFARINLDVGVAYDSNLEHVIEVINRVGNELAEDPAWKDMITAPPQFLRVNKLGDSAIEIKILGETIQLKQWEITGELRKRIVIAFNKENIEIPFPQRVIHSPNK